MAEARKTVEELTEEEKKRLLEAYASVRQAQTTPTGGGLATTAAPAGGFGAPIGEVLPVKETAEARERSVSPGTEAPADIAGALQAGGYYTEGFGGTTAGEYRDWYTEQFGQDPFEMAQALQTDWKGFTKLQPGEDPSAAWIEATGMPGFDPETGVFSAIPEEGQEATFELIESRFAQQRARESYRQGEAMLAWLEGQAIGGDPAMLRRIMPITLARAEARMGTPYQTADYSGLMGQRYMEEQQRQAKRAGGFDFFRDLLPSLVTLGGYALGGPAGGAAGATAGGFLQGGREY